MTGSPQLSALEVGYDIPAAIGMAESEIHTPCLLVDLDAFERNVANMRERCAAMGVRLRAHGKMHKSSDVARYQIEQGGSVGICCQKVSEAEAFIRGGVKDVLISNQVRDPAKIDRLARLPSLGARVIVCVDDLANIPELSAAAEGRGVTIECLVEIDCGAGRCGVGSTVEAVAIAQAIDAAPGLTFSGLQSYNGSMQHLRRPEERAEVFEKVETLTRDVVSGLQVAGLECDIVGGGGTGSYRMEGGSGLFNELQAGSYAFMDADYSEVVAPDGAHLNQGEWENALFVLTSVMSHVKPDQAVCDAGHKASAVDSGLPKVFGREDLSYIGCSDEHGVISDPNGALKVNDKLRLIPGHCDPTCNLHDWLVGVRDGKVETLWAVNARGKGY
ncbi:MAG: DSD1 family PLP-dependent enzyme [Rhodobacteraceae bacterium]|nr:DSD1 family PLP-dependent enzyme [Paracoccaceae bacterium]